MKASKIITSTVVVGAVSLATFGAANAATHRAGSATHRQARYEQRLTKAVTNGKLTSAQEQAILAEHNTLAAQLTGTTRSERRQERQQARSQALTWAQQNHLPVRWLGLRLGGHRRR